MRLWMSTWMLLAAVAVGTAAGDVRDETEYPVVARLDSDTWGWQVLVSEGIYCICTGDKFGFLKADGEEITPYCYDMAYPFHDGLACVQKDGKYGYINSAGETVIPFVYDDAAPFSEGLAYFAKGEQYGFMDESGEPVFVLDCDSVSSFREGLAYICVDGKYGYIDRRGNTVIEPVYEDAGYFADGCASVRKNGEICVIDRNGIEVSRQEEKAGGVFSRKYESIPGEYDSVKRYDDETVILEKEGTFFVYPKGAYGFETDDYDDICKVGECYLVEQDGYKGIMNANGEAVVAPVYTSFSDYDVIGDAEVYKGISYTEDGGILVMTEPSGNEDNPEIYLTNKITPRQREYLNILRWDDTGAAEDGRMIWGRTGDRRTNRFYCLDGRLVLYVRVEPYRQMGFPLSDSYFFSVRKGEVVPLLTGSECGGSLRGNYVCLYYDRQKNCVCPSIGYASGGFGGYAFGADIYSFEADEPRCLASWTELRQTTGNYDEETLLSNAGLFYNEEDEPYTKETIVKADAVTEYQVNEEQTTLEEYTEKTERYQYISFLE